MNKIPPGERGAALLAVLLLVAVIGALAAAAADRLALARAASFNAVALDQARAHADGVGRLAILVIEDLVARNPERTTLEGGWNGGERTIPLPDGGDARLSVRDGGNCFNVNSVVEGELRTALTRRHSGVLQFAALMQALGLPEADARRIAEAAADWADSDQQPTPAGAEDAVYAVASPPYRTGDTLFADVGELRSVAGMTPEIMARVEPWLCALPVAELSPINLNTLLPGQAPLLAMLGLGRLDAARARAILDGRPRGGWANTIEFWRTDPMHQLGLPLDVQLQPQLRTRWFRLDTLVQREDAEFGESLLIDARLQPARIVARRWN
ncbi:MAG: type II secretion system minor pseudopilin GspK [Sphingosinicella sp.]